MYIPIESAVISFMTNIPKDFFIVGQIFCLISTIYYTTENAWMKSPLVSLMALVPHTTPSAAACGVPAAL